MAVARRREVSALRAVVRVSALAGAAPQALGGSAAAAVVQLALQGAAARSRAARDPRMACLTDTATLQQLWIGSRLNTRCGAIRAARSSCWLMFMRPCGAC